MVLRSPPSQRFLHLSCESVRVAHERCREMHTPCHVAPRENALGSVTTGGTDGICLDKIRHWPDKFAVTRPDSGTTTLGPPAGREALVRVAWLRERQPRFEFLEPIQHLCLPKISYPLCP